jgi:hypothetical protein
MPTRRIRRLSGITTENGAVPSTPRTLENIPNFRGNYLSQGDVRPGKWDGSTWRTPNEGGRASATADVGTCFESRRYEYPRNDPGGEKIDAARELQVPNGGREYSPTRFLGKRTPDDRDRGMKGGREGRGGRGD